MIGGVGHDDIEDHLAAHFDLGRLRFEGDGEGFRWRLRVRDAGDRQHQPSKSEQNLPHKCSATPLSG
jgi:hypothetical protein